MKIRLAPLLVSVIVAAAAFATKTGPTYNFDNVFYLGIAEEYRGYSLAEAHDSVYAQIKAALPQADYAKILSDGTPDDLVRIPSYESAESYGQQLPFYSIKPVYPLLIAAFRHFGVNGVTASFCISAISLGLLAALCCSWLSRYYAPWTAAAITVLLAFSSGVFNLGVDPRPDALYAAVVLGILALSARLPRLSPLVTGLMLLSILVRPDAIIFCVMMCFAWMVVNPRDYFRPLVTLGLSVVLYFADTKMHQSYSWGLLMYHAYINYLPYPRTHPASVNLSDLVRIYVKFGQPTYSQAFITMLLAAVSALVANLATSPVRSQLVAFSAALVATLPLHFLVHPSDNLRVRSAYYIASLILLLIAVARAANKVMDHGDPIARRWLLASPVASE